MAAIKWDQPGERKFETGVDHGILYVMKDDGTYDKGVPWNGLTSVTDSPEGGEPTPLYADNMKYLDMSSNEEFKATIEAYMYPDEFYACDGSLLFVDGVAVGQQARKKFGLVYRTRVGNDSVGDAAGYKLHIVWGLLASPSEKAYETVNDSPDAITFSWEASSTPVDVTGHAAVKRAVSTIVIDSTQADETDLKTLEDLLFGTDPTTDPVSEGTDPTLPTPKQVLDIFATT